MGYNLIDTIGGTGRARGCRASDRSSHQYGDSSILPPFDSGTQKATVSRVNAVSPKEVDVDEVDVVLREDEKLDDGTTSLS